MVGVDLAMVAQQVGPPLLQSMHHGGKLQIMSWIILLMWFELTGGIGDNMAFLHQNTAQALE